jgi:hypothetical protein
MELRQINTNKTKQQIDTNSMGRLLSSTAKRTRRTMTLKIQSAVPFCMPQIDRFSCCVFPGSHVHMKITRHFAVLGSCPTSPIESRPACSSFWHSFRTSVPIYIYLLRLEFLCRFSGMQACGPSPCDAIASTKHLLQLGSTVYPMRGLLTVILNLKFSTSMCAVPLAKLPVMP